MTRYRIRSSMLPAWNDCPRRSAAKSYGWLVKKKGFELRELPPSIGAAVGTAVHKVAEVMLAAKIETGELGKLSDGIEQGMAGFSEEIAPGAIWDDTTPNRSAAEKQIRSLSHAYLVGVAEKIEPAAVELELEADAGDGFLLTGHIDLVTRDEWVRDLKTGEVSRPYYEQLGAYGLLVRSNQVCGVRGLAVDWIKRTGHTKPQPPVEVKEADATICQRAALEVVGEVKRCLLEFERTGSAAVFGCNSMSMMCSEKYCPAWGTDFCPVSRAGK
jgi:hypothetical protein